MCEPSSANEMSRLFFAVHADDKQVQKVDEWLHTAIWIQLQVGIGLKGG